MIIIPAIDLKDGKCVRLKQGRMESSTIFNENPVDQAFMWEKMGAQKIHLVDLDGSIDGRPVNLQVIKDIIRNVNVRTELGGGIRDVETVKMYLDIGINTIIVGTIAATNPELTLELLRKFPGRVAIGIDAKAGRVAVQGWTQSTDQDARELAGIFDAEAPAAFIYTDIERDGMMKGPNFASTSDFSRAVRTPVILSGGVTTLKDVKKALSLEKDGVEGVIIGRALYEGKIDLREAIALTEDSNVS
ncbi:MAG: 1-(5-phosphoribosyl)-5-[(5-phosphoribosylamino)methylideneamino]imidazole-4-carboxamide isomerase [Desulfomonilaceae bacterium]|jgi:phosphoribosylformimino-5-aminoimidazole carboxamide ribotide isomerase